MLIAKYQNLNCALTFLLHTSQPTGHFWETMQRIYVADLRNNIITDTTEFLERSWK